MPFPFDELWETYIGQPYGLDMLDVLEVWDEDKLDHYRAEKKDLWPDPS
jgi:hypothetical protein